MLQITLQLQEIAAALEVDFIRSENLTQSNIQVHYKELTRPVIIYAGSGEQNNYFEGAQPLQKVAAEIYILVKKIDVDQLAEVTDIQLFRTKQIAANIMYQFDSPRDILTYKTDPISILDDQLIGHLLTAEFILEGNVCGQIEPPPLYFEGTFEELNNNGGGFVRLQGASNGNLEVEFGDIVIFTTDDGKFIDVESVARGGAIETQINLEMAFTEFASGGTYKTPIETAKIQPL